MSHLNDMLMMPSAIAEAEARGLCRALEARFAECGLPLHPEKTKIVYCKDANRFGA